MKKFSIITLFLALLSMTMQAQENTYNMVIEMTNGTKITIGPNDIRSLTFNNGELTVTGGNLQDWMESVAKLEDIEALKMYVTDLVTDLQSRGLDLEPLKEYFYINSYWDAGKKVSQAIVDKFQEHGNRLEGNEMMIYELRSRVDNLEAEIENLKSQLGN